MPPNTTAPKLKSLHIKQFIFLFGSLAAFFYAWLTWLIIQKNADNQYIPEINCATNINGNLSVSFKKSSLLSHPHNTLKTTNTTATNKKYNFTAAICAVVLDHEAYLLEWIDYNLLALEFETIYLYDNSDNFDLQQWYQNTRNHPIYSRVIVEHKPKQYHFKKKNEGFQISVYNDCVYRYGQGYTRKIDENGTTYQGKGSWVDSPKHDYMALVDADEFIVFQKYGLPGGHSTIHDLLNEYLVPYGGALVVNWALFGSADRSIYSPLPVLKRFQYRDAKPIGTIKSIVTSKHFKEMLNPHAVSLHENYAPHDTLKPGNLQQISGTTRASNKNKPAEVLLLYHYRFLSKKEHLQKRCNSGNWNNWKCIKEGEKPDEKLPSHVFIRPGEMFDDRAWKFLTDKVEKYQVFDGPEWEDFT